MKTLLLSALSFSLLIAQDMSQMNGQQMQNMMQDMQKIQVCMAKVDFNSLAALQEKSYTVQKEIEKMCKNKQKDKAQEKAISFSNEVMSYPAIIQLKACSKGSAMESLMNTSQTDFQKQHVCDGMNIDFGMPSQQRINW